jgi:two-component system, cell cycle response regulator
MQANDKLAVLYHASQVVLSTLDPDKVLLGILQIVWEQLHAANVAIFLLEPGQGQLRLQHRLGNVDERAPIYMPVGTGLVGAAAKEMQPIYVPDVRSDARYFDGIPGTRSELVIPLLVRGELAGVLDIQAQEPSAFSGEEVELMKMFSVQASIALENAQLYATAKRRASQLEAINAIARRTTALHELDQLMAEVCALLKAKFGVADAAVLLLDGDTLRTAYRTGAPPSPAEAAVKNDAARACLDRDAPELREAGPDTAHLFLPLHFGGKLGVLVLHGKTSQFTAPELEPLDAVADIFAGAIKNCQQLDLARRLAYRDGLTGAYNRRFFEERMTAEFHRATRYGSRLSLLLIDVDHFKAINDDFGHLAGDEVLRGMARLFATSLRRTDLVCRFGGEEFAVLLPEAGVAQAREVAEKLRRLVEQHAFPGVDRPVTVSIGTSHLPGLAVTRNDMIAAADAALYASKQAGRNRVMSAADPENEWVQEAEV